MLEWSTDALKRELGAHVPTDGTQLPWFLGVLAGLVSWFAAAFCLCWLGACLAGVDSTWFVLGIVFTLAGAVVARSKDVVPDLGMVVLGQLGVIASIVGRMLLVAGFVSTTRSDETGTAVFVCAMELVFVVLYPQSLQRFYSTIAGLTAIVIALHGTENAGVRELLGLATALGAVGLLGSVHTLERRLVRLDPKILRLDTRVLSNLVEPVGMGAATWTLCLEGLRIGERTAWDWIGVGYGLLAFGVIVGLVGVHRIDGRARIASVIGAIALIALGRFVPGLPLAVVFTLVAVHRRNTKLAGLALVFAFAYAGLFYYQLELTLLVKGLALMGGGALLLALRAIGLVHAGPSVPRPAPGPWVRITAAVGLLVVLGSVVGKVASAELQLAGGERVYLRLAPVDPRSLVQGDYMTLAYALDSEARALDPGRAVAVLDERGIIEHIEADRPSLSASERWIQVAPTAGRRSPIATHAYLFQEGSAELYAEATYGIFALSGERLLLIGLAGEDLQPLGTERPAW